MASSSKRTVGLAMVMVGLAGVLFVGGALGRVGGSGSGSDAGTDAAALATAGPRADGGSVSALQARVQRVPDDDRAWASLGLAYVAQARITGDPSYYPKADGVLTRSLAINEDDNDVAAAGMAALAAARHDFAAAADWARRGLAVNPSSALLYGALNDAETQLGRYPEAFDAAQRMIDLRPDTASLARASYTWELRGDLAQATELMQRALTDAANDGDRAFARYYLGELAFNGGDPQAALVQYQAGLAADASYVPLLEGRAKAEAALGQFDAAVADYTEVVARVPQPAYLIAFGELLESLGRNAEAQDQYRTLEATSTLLKANGVALDVEPALFGADHGDPVTALQAAESGIANRQFLDMADAYGWALHVNGRDAEALDWSTRSLALGTRSALFRYHAGMIRLALGDTAGARDELSTALSINPHFSPLAAPLARAALGRLGDAP
jgi:tetratricopeptide (TPR) repeat protein